MQCACAILSSVACPALPYFFHIISQTARFSAGRDYWTQNVFWFSLQLLSETFLILRRNGRDIITNAHRPSCKIPVVIVRFSWNLNFLNRFSKTTHENPSSGGPTVPCGRTGMTKLTVAFNNFANVHKNETLSLRRPIRQLLGLSHCNSVCPATYMVKAVATTVSMLTHVFQLKILLSVMNL